MDVPAAGSLIMRVVAGRLRGRRLETPAGSAIRPTADRVREALFNILAHGERVPGGLAGAVVLDAFAGTGALGIEALSRGVVQATFLDDDEKAVRLIRRNLETLGLARQANVLRRDATKPGTRVGAPATLAFLDPPYGQGLAAPALAALAAGGWLAAGALCVVEVGARDALDPPTGFAAEDERRYGAARLVLVRCTT